MKIDGDTQRILLGGWNFRVWYKICVAVYGRVINGMEPSRLLAPPFFGRQ